MEKLVAGAEAIPGGARVVIGTGGHMTVFQADARSLIVFARAIVQAAVLGNRMENEDNEDGDNETEGAPDGKLFD